MALASLFRRRSRAAYTPESPIPTGAGAVDITVHDPVGLPMAETQVVFRTAGGQDVMTGVTDPNGQLSVTLPPGQYQLVMTCDGFQPLRVNAEVQVGQRTPVRPLVMELAPATPLPAPGQWEIDPAHTSIRFVARHIGLAEVHGRFNRFEGSLWIDQEMRNSRVEVTIDATSVDTGVKMRDDHLRSADFLDVEHHPYLQFVSDRFVHKGGARWAVQGVLHLHGVNRNVTLDTRYLGVGTGMEGETRVACAAKTELHREDFTLDWRAMLAKGIAVVGPTIRIELDIQAVQQ